MIDKRLLKSYYNSFNTKAFICLYPGMTCSEKPIRAHSIQNSKVFDLLSDKDHLVSIQQITNKSHAPVPSFGLIGRNKASVFEGLCQHHDKSLFKPIDDSDFEVDDKEQLFLLAYRSVLKELHASMTRAIKIQEGYFSKAHLGLCAKDAPSMEGEFALQNIMDAFDTYEYKIGFDNAFLAGNYDYLTHQIFKIETDRATVACSQLFSIDSFQFRDTVPRVLMNIFPVNNKLTYAIFSSTKDESSQVNDYLFKCLRSNNVSVRNYEISKLIIRNSDNFFISPLHFSTWSESKKSKVLQHCADTVFKDVEQDDVDFYLF
ncbi:hypothetical protein [Pontibacter kalidii]|uniref:hypothetical protein n=1 Tax=Pontibacter kalidii TaxID=2592049 RepID=UPI0022500EAD|nr:hypothetical protein [Pontibacter kalidii]